MKAERGSVPGRRRHLVRHSLTANAIFSGASGTVLVAASGPIAEFLGWSSPTAAHVLFGIGAGLLVFAAVLVVTARATRLNEAVVRGIVGLDVAWVLSSVSLLALGLAPNVRGAAVIGGVAAVVALLAAGQAAGLARSRRDGRGTAT